MPTDRSVVRDRKRRGSNQINIKAHLGGLPRSAKVGQIMRGVIVGVFAIVSDAPARNKSTNLLEHACACPCGHVIAIPHSILVYNAPAKCPVCEKEAVERRRMEYAASKAAGEMALEKWRQEQRVARYQAQQVAPEGEQHVKQGI